MRSARLKKGAFTGVRGTAESDTPAPAKGATLVVASIATALVLIVFTVPLTTLTGTVHAFGGRSRTQAWILSAMSVGAASGLLGSGAIGDDYGRRRTFWRERSCWLCFSPWALARMRWC